MQLQYSFRKELYKPTGGTVCLVDVAAPYEMLFEICMLDTPKAVATFSQAIQQEKPAQPPTLDGSPTDNIKRFSFEQILLHVDGEQTVLVTFDDDNNPVEQQLPTADLLQLLTDWQAFLVANGVKD